MGRGVNEAEEILYGNFVASPRAEVRRPTIDMSDWLGLLENGYTPEEINRLLPKISETLGVPLSCLWNEYNVADGFCGDSEIGIIIDQKLYELPLDVQDALYEHGVGVERVQEIYLGEIEAEGSLLTTSRLFQEGCNSCAVD